MKLRKAVAFLLASGYSFDRLGQRGRKWGWRIHDEDGEVACGRGGGKAIKRWIRFLVNVERDREVRYRANRYGSKFTMCFAGAFEEVERTTK